MQRAAEKLHLDCALMATWQTCRLTLLTGILLLVLLLSMVDHKCTPPCGKSYGRQGYLIRHQVDCKDHLRYLEDQSSRRSGRKIFRCSQAFEIDNVVGSSQFESNQTLHNVNHSFLFVL